MPTSLLMICARASGTTDEDATDLHMLAAAIELINVALMTHASLPDDGPVVENSPLLSMGQAAGVLLGDCLYTRAFEMISRSRNALAIHEIAALTGHMVTACTLERFPQAGHYVSQRNSSQSLRGVVWSACCSLGSRIAKGTDEQYDLLHELGGLFALLWERSAVPPLGKPDTARDVTSLVHTMSDTVVRASEILSQALPASRYRTALESLVTNLASPT